MSFCHECGSEVNEEERYCPVCGIALRSPVIENVSEEGAEEAEPEEQAKAEVEDQVSEEAGEAEASPGRADLKEEPEPAPAEVPSDEFVDISALRSDEPDEVEEAETTEGEPVAASVESVSEKEAREPADAPKPAESDASHPEPPSPDILASGTRSETESAPEENATAAEEAETPSTEVRPADEVIQTPLPSEPAPSAQEAAASSAPSEEPEAPSAEPQIEASARADVEPEEPSKEEPEPVVTPHAAAPENDAAEVQEEEDEAVASEPAGEEEDEPDFLEDQTLISMPVPKADIEAAKKQAASREPIKAEALNKPSKEEPEETPKAQAAPGEQAASEPKPAEQQAPEPPPVSPPARAAEEGSDEEEDEGGPSTTPNIGKGDTDGSKAPKLKPLGEGTVLNGRYEVVRKIGGGGMGAVYLASDKNLGGVLRAVKEMVQSYIEEDQQEKAVQDFKRESMLLTSLEHPSIPTIYDYFFDDEAHRFYLVMKYISGGDLAAKLRAAPEGKLDEEEVTEWAIQIADVLDYLHNRQPPIVYRDLKPANIMLDGNSGKVMLIDFGIARWINKEEKGVTAVGTMGYAPPELFSGNVVPSSDIYSLGSTIFHLLTGADPQNNPLLIFDFEKNPKPRQINPRLSDQIETILMRAVEYNAEKRFSSAAEMRDALTAHLSNLNAGKVTHGKTESPKSVGFSEQTVFCGFCGQKIVATDMFCAFCGAKQPLAQPGVQSQEYVPVNLTAKLLIEGTSQLDYPSFELAKDENLVGRRDPMSNIFPEVDLSKFDPQTKISRKHARIWRDGEKFMLEDLGSSNGTVLMPSSSETVRLAPHQAAELSHGDRIKLGDTTLHFVISA